MEYQYSLQPYKGPASRSVCPSCNERNQFALYLANNTGEPLHDSVGRCNRNDSCGYHYTPKQFFIDNGTDRPVYVHQVKPPGPVNPVSFIPFEVFEKSGSEFQDALKNNFIQFLLTLFDLDTVNDTIEKYRIGSSTAWPGSTIFWQTDTEGNIRTGKIMGYDSETGKREKKPVPQINWVHSFEKLPGFNLQQCLYGSHLLVSDIDKTIAVVESEKTCILASMLLPQYSWISRGGKNGAKIYLNDIHRCLIGRKVILFPDLGAFDAWSNDAEVLAAAGINITVSRFLEDLATDEERKAGLDIADYLLKDHVKLQSAPAKPSTLEIDGISDPGNDLELFFKYGPFPKKMKIDLAYNITDVNVFVQAHLDCIRGNRDKKSCQPYVDRLELLRRVLIGSP